MGKDPHDRSERYERRHPSMTEVEEARIGHRLRAQREAQRLTLSQLADASGLTKGFLSKVERDLATPSVASLLRLCDGLGLSIGELFDETNGQDLVRAGAYPAIGFGGQGMAESLLTPLRERRLQVIHSVIEPGGGSGAETYELPADIEFVFILGGTIELTVDDQVHLLDTGDAITFAPSARHSFSNPSDHLSAEVLWVLAPALPVTAEPDEHAIAWR
jgi:transcriptional regulator with XRE-family HTH domain